MTPFCDTIFFGQAKKMNKQIFQVAEPVNSDLAQRTRFQNAKMNDNITIMAEP
jgi:hypothetical protein